MLKSDDRRALAACLCATDPSGRGRFFCVTGLGEQAAGQIAVLVLTMWPALYDREPPRTDQIVAFVQAVQERFQMRVWSEVTVDDIVEAMDASAGQSRP